MYKKDETSIMELYCSIYKNIYTTINENKEISPKRKYSVGGDLEEELENKVERKLAISRNEISKNKKGMLYWAYLKNAKIRFTSDIPTMAVNAAGVIFINPSFGLNEISQDEFTAVLLHEVGHVFYDSFRRKKWRNHNLWNVATDYFINMKLIQDGFKIPKNCLYPEETSEGKWVITKYDFDMENKNAEKLYQFLENHQKENKKNKKECEDKPRSIRSN